MLAIRMQRVGRKGNAQYRVVVQDSSRTPTSGKIVSQVGRFNPHTKEVVLDTAEVEKYLKNGAQPSERVVKLLQNEGVKLPSWVTAEKKDDKRAIKNPEKLRKNQPKEEPAVTVEAPKEAEAPAKPEVPAEPEAEKATETNES